MLVLNPGILRYSTIIKYQFMVETEFHGKKYFQIVSIVRANLNIIPQVTLRLDYYHFIILKL